MDEGSSQGWARRDRRFSPVALRTRKLFLWLQEDAQLSCSLYTSICLYAIWWPVREGYNLQKRPWSS